MKKTIGALVAGVLLALPGSAFAYGGGYAPVFGANYVYGVGGSNPYVGNCNYQDACAFSNYGYANPYQQPIPTYQLYWCNGVQQYWPCSPSSPANNYAYTPTPQPYYYPPQQQQQYYYYPQQYNTYSYYDYYNTSYSYGYNNNYYGW